MIAISTWTRPVATNDINWIALTLNRAQEIMSYSDSGLAEEVSNDPDTKLTIPDWFEFQYLRSKWHEERGITSSLTKIVTCPTYLRIIGMGERAVPLILQQIREEGDDPDFWFWALEAITGQNPVPEVDLGNMQAMAEAWLNWGLYR